MQSLAFPAENASLKTEPSLNPGDLFTSEVLRKGEWNYGQPPKFIPGWFRWGVTDRLTVQLDLTAWLGRVPDMNVRWALIPKYSNRPSLAWETMVLYFDPTLDNLKDLDENDPHLFIQRHGMAGYSRLNFNMPLTNTMEGVLSGGVSYSEKLTIHNEDHADFHGNSFSYLWDPAFSLGVVVRPSDIWSFHASLSYGETFLFLENRPRKWQGNYGFRIIPFRHKSSAFLRNLRLEMNAIVSYFPDAKETRSLPIPIFPALYWTWF